MTTPLSEIRNHDGSLPRVTDLGAYPLVYVADDGETMCADCAALPEAHEGGEPDGWRIDGYQVHWEGPPEHCAHCNREIESAYGEPDAEPSNPALDALRHHVSGAVARGEAEAIWEQQ